MRKLIATIIISMFATLGRAGVIEWADWTASDLEGATGSVAGVGLDFTGALVFAQLEDGVMAGTGAGASTDYWTEGVPAPYTGNAVVDNRPPAFELLAFNLDSFNSLVFDSPVEDPVMAIVSQGRPNVSVTYDFDTPFTLLSEGRGFWGDGTFSLGPGDVLIGNELHAVIQFHGVVSQINWFSTEEFWHGFTIGIPSAETPEPGMVLLFGPGVIAMLGATNRRRTWCRRGKPPSSST